jgi:short-subunit dehydrogenase
MASRERLRLAGSTALVTGATGGIGEAIARALSARGTRLLVSGRREAELLRLAEDLSGQAIVADLALPEDVDRLAAAAVEAGVQVLVANAGVPASGLLAELSQREVDGMLAVNLRAPIALARALSPPMAARGQGHLVFVSSLQGKAAVPQSSIYAATKFGLRGFALSLRQDLRGSGVGVSVVMPGFIRDAGMFAETGYRLPPGVGTKSPGDVASAVIAAVEHNRAELDVAPLGLRAAAAIAAFAPGFAERASRLLGSHRIAAGVTARQRDQR